MFGACWSQMGYQWKCLINVHGGEYLLLGMMEQCFKIMRKRQPDRHPTSQDRRP